MGRRPWRRSQEHLVGRHPRREHEGTVAVVGEPDVDASPHGPCGADLAGFVTLGGHDERGAAHAVLAEGSLVEQACGDDRSVHRDEVLGGQSERAVRCGRYARRHVMCVPPGDPSTGSIPAPFGECTPGPAEREVLADESRWTGYPPRVYSAAMKDPVCGMDVDRPPPRRPGNTPGRRTTSAPSGAWRRSARTQNGSCRWTTPTGGCECRPARPRRYLCTATR